MTWSLQLKSGDINPSGSLGYRVVTGPQKLAQDLRGWVLEPRGSDPMHPEYGSVLDGGTRPDGSAISTMIGETITKERMMDVEAELRRIMQVYQTMQIQRLQREQYALGGKNTFAPGEILFDVRSIEMRQMNDIVVAAVHIRSNNGQSISLAQAVGG